MPTELWKKINYKTPIKYFINNYIREYDLSKANISSLFYMNRINKHEFMVYSKMDKIDRERKIGLWIKNDKSVYDDIQKGILFAKKQLSLANNLEDINIISIKNDAMFILGDELSQTTFYPFEFKIKNIYTVYMQLAELEIYYNDHMLKDSIKTTIDIKGISDDKLEYHKDGMLDLICDVCYKFQRENITDTVNWLSNMYKLYIERKLPIQYYRSFDSDSGFLINTFIRSVILNDMDSSMIKAIDINRNLLILREIMSIAINIYDNCK